MTSPLVQSTLQAAALSAASNILAQFIRSYQAESLFAIDWTPVFQFALYTLLTCPPNYLWQSTLESLFPGQTTRPTSSAIAAAGSNNEKELDSEESAHTLTETRLNLPNTLIKFAIDQTLNASLNTLAFSFLLAGFRGATMDQAVHATRTEFWPLMLAGYKLWPFVSFVNYAVVKTVAGRTLVGSLAGVAWTVYLSLVAGDQIEVTRAEMLV